MKKLLQLSIIILPVSFFLIFFILLTEENQFPGADYREFDLPVFELKILNNDVSIANSDLEGDYVMNVWASWCITCRIEHPYLASLAKMVYQSLVSIIKMRKSMLLSGYQSMETLIN